MQGTLTKILDSQPILAKKFNDNCKNEIHKILMPFVKWIKIIIKLITSELYNHSQGKITFVMIVSNKNKTLVMKITAVITLLYLNIFACEHSGLWLTAAQPLYIDAKYAKNHHYFKQNFKIALSAIFISRFCVTF